MIAANDADIMRVTLYMTLSQWKALSAWNIGSLEQGVETWLHLSQEQGGQITDDYTRTLQKLEAEIACTVAHHTSSAGVFDYSAVCLPNPMGGSTDRSPDSKSREGCHKSSDHQQSDV
jgi:hypothetical protein